MKKNRRNTTSLRAEMLEARMALAGDVAVALEGELLTLRGDQLDNQVVLTRTLAGNVVVAGQNGTLINGLPSVTLIRPTLNAVDIRTEGGNDVVTLRNMQIANDLNVDLGSGNDRLNASLAAPNLVGGNASILGDLGADTIALAGVTVREDLVVDGGLGALNATLSDVSVDKTLSVIGGDANDIVTLARLTAGSDLLIETKEGTDRVTLTDVSANGLFVDTGENGVLGIEQVTLTRVRTVEDLGIFTGKGNDTVNLTDVTSGKSLIVSTDDGNDRIVATRVAAAVDAVFEGGAGVDLLDDNGITAGVQKIIKEFESLI